MVGVLWVEPKAGRLSRFHIRVCAEGEAERVCCVERPCDVYDGCGAVTVAVDVEYGAMDAVSLPSTAPAMVVRHWGKWLQERAIVDSICMNCICACVRACRPGTGAAALWC